jgi:hypothetical protein
MRAHHGWAALFAISLVWMSLLTYNAATKQSGEDIAAAKRAYAITQVERGNVVRAYLRYDVRQSKNNPQERADLADTLFPILDAEATVDSGRNTPLPHDEQEAYIEQIARGIVPK